MTAAAAAAQPEGAAAAASSSPFAVVLSGGLLTQGGLYAQRLVQLVGQQLPAARVAFPRRGVAEGAALLALAKLLQRQQPHEQETAPF